MGRGEGAFLEYILLKDFAEVKERAILEKLFCKTASIFEDEYENTANIKNGQKAQLKSFRTRVTNLKLKHRDQIASLARDLREDFRELGSIEFTYRAGVFKSLRWDVNGWRQFDFCTEYFKTTGKSISQSWVSRMEELSRVKVKPDTDYNTPLNQRRRYVSLQDAFDCAQTFKVDAGLFLPSLFTSP